MPARKSKGDRRHGDQTALASLGSGLLAATWLAALVAVPLFFNPRTERVFEPDKLALVVLLALVAACAHVTRMTESPMTVRLSRSPLVWSIVFALTAVVVGAVLSEVPAVSWWGLYRRGQGVVVYGALATLAAGAAVTARRPGMLSMWLRLTIVTCVPVSLYALLQSAGVDNVSWTGTGLDARSRPFGPMGNPIFLGAYLVMALPVLWLGVIDAWRRYRSKSNGALLQLQLVVAVAAAALVVCALAVSQSRGPVLALLAGSAMFTLIWGAATGKRTVVIGVVAAVAIVMVGLVGLGRTQSDSLGRLSRMLSTESRTAQERLLVWEALGDLALSDPKRALVGYGPETAGYAMSPFLSEDLARLAPNQVFDRAHNMALEWWVSAGLMGLLALVAMFVSVFVETFGRIGLFVRKNDRPLLVGLMAAGLLVGMLGPAAAGRAMYAPVAGPFGLLAGVGAFLVWLSVRPPRSTDAGIVAGNGHLSMASWILIALASALTSHLVEASVGLPTAAGELLFWVYLGLLVALAARPRGATDAEGSGSANTHATQHDGSPAPLADGVAGGWTNELPAGNDHASGTAGGGSRGGPSDPDAGWASGLAGGAIVGLALATVAFAPILVPSRDGTFGSPLLWLLPALVWLAADAAGLRSTGHRSALFARVGVPVVLVIGMILLEGTIGGAAAGYATALLVAVFVAARGFSGPLRGRSMGEPWRWLVVASAVVVAAVAAWRIVMVPTIADSHIRAGLEAVARRDSHGALVHFERAAAVWPQQPAYATYLSAAYRDLSVDPTLSPDERDAAFVAAEAVLTSSYARVPEVSLLRRLATLYRDRADSYADPQVRAELLAKSLGHLDESLSRWPTNPTSIAEKAATLERTGDARTAEALYRRSIDIGGPEASWLVGLSRSALAQGEPNAGQDAMARAVALDPGQPETVGRLVDEGAHFDVPLPGAILSQIMYLVLTERLEEARRLHSAVIEQAPSTEGVEAMGRWLGDQ